MYTPLQKNCGAKRTLQESERKTTLFFKKKKKILINENEQFVQQVRKCRIFWFYKLKKF